MKSSFCLLMLPAVLLFGPIPPAMANKVETEPSQPRSLDDAFTDSGELKLTLVRGSRLTSFVWEAAGREFRMPEVRRYIRKLACSGITLAVSMRVQPHFQMADIGDAIRELRDAGAYMVSWSQSQGSLGMRGGGTAAHSHGSGRSSCPP